MFSLLVTALVVAASFGWYVHDQMAKHAAHLETLDAALQRANRTAAAYHHITDLTEQRRRAMNKSLDDFQTAYNKLRDTAPAGFASVESGHLDEQAHAYRYDDIAQYAQANLPGSEFSKLNVSLSPLLKRSDEFSDVAHATAATLREAISNPWSVMSISADKFWGAYDTAHTAIHDAFQKYQNAVYALQESADTQLAIARNRLGNLKNESFIDSLQHP